MTQVQNMWQVKIVFKVILILSINWVNAVKLPPFIKLCSRSDPELDACILKNGKEALPNIIKGVKEMHIPKMSPLFMSQFELNNARDLSIILRNITVEGFDTTELLDSKTDFQSKIMQFSISIEELNFYSRYFIDAKLMFLPIKGEGDATIKLFKPLFSMKCYFDILKEKDGEYMRAKNCEVLFDIQNAHFNLTNLFNGDKRLGDQLNIFLNENWKDIANEARPFLQQAISSVVVSLINSFATGIKFDDIFLP